MSFNPADFEEDDGFDEEAAAALDEVLDNRPTKRAKPAPSVVDLCAEEEEVKKPPPKPYQQFAGDVSLSEEAELRRAEGLPPLAADAASEQPPPPRSREGDLCHSCGQLGHWSSQCPNKQPAAGDEPPAPQCPCGAGPASTLTARTERNNGRKFFKCPLGKEGGCSFFQWADQPAVAPAVAGSGGVGGVGGVRSEEQL